MVTAVNISIDDLELAAAPGWRAFEEDRLGDWLLRAAGGFTGRANSALAAGDPGLPLRAAIEKVRRWYSERGLPAMIAVAYPTGRPAASALNRTLGPTRSISARSRYKACSLTGHSTDQCRFPTC
jgi:hypothetical protein